MLQNAQTNKLVPWLVTAVDSSKAETIVSCLFSLANRLSLSMVANRLSRVATSLLSSSRSRPTIRIRPCYHASWNKRRSWERSNKPNKICFAYFSSCRGPLKGIDGRPAHKQALIEKHRRIGKENLHWLVKSLPAVKKRQQRRVMWPLPSGWRLPTMEMGMMKSNLNSLLAIREAVKHSFAVVFVFLPTEQAETYHILSRVADTGLFWP